MPSAKMHLPVAYRQFLGGRAENIRKDSRMSENGRAPDPCRGRWENSNAAIVRRSIHSGFIAAICPGTVESFYSQAGRI
jgi:hypothetical protein